jgi:hypothetical protein
VKQTESSAEKKRRKKSKKEIPETGAAGILYTQKITIEKIYFNLTIMEEAEKKNMFKASELSYSLSGLAIYGKKAEGGVEIHVQNIFR